MAFLRALRIDRLMGRVNRNMTAAVRLMQSREAPDKALRHNRAAITAATKLADLEPDEDEHRQMLGQLHYNGAAIYEQLGRLDLAVASARLALLHYELLPGGDVAPENIHTLRLLSLQGHFGPPPVDTRRAMEAVELAADTRARLARLLARHSGPDAADEVHALGRAAIAAYDRLIESDPRRRTGLQRVTTQYAEAKRALAER